MRRRKNEGPNTDEQTILERETRARWESLRHSYIAWAANSGEPLSEFNHIVDSQVKYARVQYQKQRISAELEESSAIWDHISQDEVGVLQALLATNPFEAVMHNFLEDNPKLLVQAMSGGHGLTWSLKTGGKAGIVTD
jgi:hypothetical protein